MLREIINHQYFLPLQKEISRGFFFKIKFFRIVNLIKFSNQDSKLLIRIMDVTCNFLRNMADYGINVILGHNYIEDIEYQCRLIYDHYHLLNLVVNLLKFINI